MVFKDNTMHYMCITFMWCVYIWSATNMFGIPSGPVLKHGLRSLAYMQVIGYIINYKFKSIINITIMGLTM